MARQDDELVLNGVISEVVVEIHGVHQAIVDIVGLIIKQGEVGI